MSALIVRSIRFSNSISVEAWHDARYEVRTLRRSPGFAAVAVLTLALGIGATTAIFTVVNAVLLRPLPYPSSERLVRIVETPRAQDETGVAQRRAVGVTLSDLATFRSQTKTLSHIGVYAGATMLLAGRGEPSRLEGTRLSPAVFEMIGARPLVGRTFVSRDETAEGEPVVVLGHALWRRLFGGRGDILGERLNLDGRSFSVVGVMPSGFQFPDAQTQMWIPYVLAGPALRARVPPIARLADGVSIPAASAEVASILSGLSTIFAAVAALAAFVPARRATTVDPLMALRSE